MVVLKGYLDIIKNALVANEFECDDVICLDDLDKNDLYVFPMGIDAFKYYWKGYKHFILWQQGVTADESYMRNQSKLRYSMLNYIDCFAMKKAKMILFCSDFMKKHYENLANQSFSHKSYLMPCYNEELSLTDIDKKDYDKKYFAYVGSLDLWQCFDKIAALYKEIENIYPEARFKVLTFSVQEAVEKIEALEIKNYEVKSVKKEEVQNELKDVVYGFVIREDSVVNRVATPTKLSSYLSVGIIPIFSTVLEDFSRISQSMKYVIPLDESMNVSSIVDKIDKRVEKDILRQEYINLFSTYYGTKYHIAQLVKLVKGIFQ